MTNEEKQDAEYKAGVLQRAAARRLDETTVFKDLLGKRVKVTGSMNVKGKVIGFAGYEQGIDIKGIYVIHVDESIYVPELKGFLSHFLINALLLEEIE